MYIIIFIITPLIVDAKITINITIHNTDVGINYQGIDKKLVTDKELKLFNITTENINKAFRVELGKVPDDFFLRNPTPYGNIFDDFNWEEMKRRFKVKEIKLLDILEENVVLNSHEHINYTPNDIKSPSTMMTKEVENTVTSTWSKFGLPDDEIYYGLHFNFTYGVLKYTNKWRNGGLHASKMTIGVTRPAIIIKPGQTVVTKLKALKMILLIELVYDAHLTGSIIANYAHTYGKYHFWAPSVKSIMKAGAMRNEIITTETLEVRCFTNPSLEVYDKLTGEVVEPIKKKRPLIKIMNSKNKTRILYLKKKKTKFERKGK